MLLFKKNSILIVLFVLASCKLWSNDTTKTVITGWCPDFYKMQFAGNIGFISIGSGYSFFSKKLQSAIFYSYIPKTLTGRDIHSMTFKNSYFICNFNMNPYLKTGPYIGASLSYSGYLPLQGLPHLGIYFYKGCQHKLKGIDVYFEAGSTVSYLQKYFNNNTLRFSKVINFAIGTSFYLK